MSGRDAYLELGYHQPAANPNPEPIQAPLETDHLAVSALDSAHSAPPTPPQLPQADTVSENGSSDYLAGLSVILLVLLIGLASGYFGRGLFGNSGGPAISELSLLDSAPVLSGEPLLSGASSNVVFMGSDASDQVLAIEPTESGNALMLVKSYAGVASNGTETRLMRYNASDVSGTPLAGSQIKSLKGEGLHLARLEDGALIAVTLDKEMLRVSRLNENGGTLWTESFPTSALDRSEVAISEGAKSLIISAPGETRVMTRLVSIDSDGLVEWQNSFDRPSTWQKSYVSVDQNGQTYALLGADNGGQAIGDQTVATVDMDGRIIRKRRVTLGNEDIVSGLAARPEGGVTLFVSGEFPRLIQFDSFGQRLTSTDLPYMQHLNDARMIEAEHGDVLIASTYALMGNRVELMLEQRTATGAAFGQRSYALPEGATLDGLVKIDEGEYLIAGSVRRERYLPTDVFVQRIAFTPGAQEMPSNPTMASYSTVSLDESPFDLGDTSLASEEVAALDPSVETNSMPIIASLTVAPSTAITEDAIEATAESDTTSPSESAADLAPQPAATTPAETTNDPELTLTSAEPSELQASIIDDQPVIFLQPRSDGSPDINSAAISRFIDQSIVTQCRFTCMDAVSGDLFPMTGHFLPAVLGTAKDVDNVHSGVCRSADLAAALDTKPVCGIN